MDENYLQFEPRVNDFGDSYHRPDEELYSDINTAIRNIRRKYRHYNDYVIAMRTIEDYLEQLIDKYGGRKNFKIALDLGNVSEYIPPIPKFRNTANNRMQSDCGTVLSEVDGEPDFELSEEHAQAVELERVDSGNGMDMVESHLVYLPFDVRNKSAKRILDNEDAIVSELEMLQNFSNNQSSSKKKRKKSSHNLYKESQRRRKALDKAMRPKTIGKIIKEYNDYCNGLTGDDDNGMTLYRGVMIPTDELNNINVAKDFQSAGFFAKEDLSTVNSKKLRKMIKKQDKKKGKKKKHRDEDDEDMDGFIDAYDKSDKFGSSYEAFKHEMETFTSDGMR